MGSIFASPHHSGFIESNVPYVPNTVFIEALTVSAMAGSDSKNKFVEAKSMSVSAVLILT